MPTPRQPLRRMLGASLFHQRAASFHVRVQRRYWAFGPRRKSCLIEIRTIHAKGLARLRLRPTRPVYLRPYSVRLGARIDAIYTTVNVDLACRVDPRLPPGTSPYKAFTFSSRVANQRGSCLKCLVEQDLPRHACLRARASACILQNLTHLHHVLVSQGLLSSLSDLAVRV